MGLQSTKNNLKIIEDMLYHCNRIQSDLMKVGNDKGKYLDDETVQGSISFSLIQLGESAKRVPVELKDRYRDVKWKGTAGLRDVIAHGYDTISLDELWDIIINDIPILRKSLIRIVSELIENEGVTPL